MDFELLVPVIVIAFDRRLINRPVHSLHLAISPWVLDFRQALFNSIFATTHVEHVVHVDSLWAVRITRCKGELKTVIREGGVYFIRNGFDERCQESLCRTPTGCLHQLDEGKFTRQINRHIKIELSFRSLHFHDIDVEVADRIGFQLSFRRLIAFDLWRP